MTFRLPERSTSGNLLLLFIVTNASGGTTIAANGVTDDASQTWTNVIGGTTGIGGTNGRGWVFKMENTAASAQKISVALSVNNGFTQVVLMEITNVQVSNAIAKTWSNEGIVTNTAWDSGAAQTPTAGSSIYQAAFQTTGTTYIGGGVSTAGTNYSLELDSITEGCPSQSWENVTATSHSPTITVTTTSTWLTMAVEVKAGANGSDGAAFRTKRLQGTNWSSVNTASFPWHLPTDGNLILIDTSTGNGGVQHIASISGATFTEHANSPLNNSSTTVQHHHADNTTASRTALNGTVTLSAVNSNGGTCWFRDIVGANTVPLDTQTSAIGTQSVAGNLQPLTVSPSGGTRLCTVYIDHDSGSETGTVTANDNFLIPWAQQDGTSLNQFCMDSGFATAIISSGTYSPNFTRAATAAGSWTSLGASYKAAATVLPIPNLILAPYRPA